MNGEHRLDGEARLSPEDLAYEILKKTGSPMHYRELFEEILRVKQVPPEKQGRLMAEIHTQINLDPRFHYWGDARWGLREWVEQDSLKEEPLEEDEVEELEIEEEEEETDEELGEEEEERIYPDFDEEEE